MKVVIFGSTGRTGSELVRQAVFQGHQVTAFARHPERQGFGHDNLRVIKGDVRDPARVAEALKGQEGVICALGGVLGEHPNDVCSVGTLHILAAMAEHGVRRGVWLTAAGTGDSYRSSGWVIRLMTHTLLREVYQDKERQEAMIRAAAAEWVIVRPVGLTNGMQRRNYRAAELLPVRGMAWISRADVAEFMVAQLTRDEFLRRAPVISR